MNRLFLTLGVAAFIGLAGFCGQVSADTIPYAYNPAGSIFNYHFPDSSSNLSTGTATDLSTAGNNATSHYFTDTGLSSNVPAGMTGYSMDSGVSGDGKGLRTVGTHLLDTQDVAKYGGFIYDVWVYPTAWASTWGGFIISYSGTESLRIGPSTDQKYGTDQKFVFNISNANTSDILIKSSVIALNNWYHVVAVFDTEGNEAIYGTVGNKTGWYVKGKMSLYVNDVLAASAAMTSTRKDYSGDDINQPFGVGVQPLPGSTSYDFPGLIYNPKVSYLNAIPEPSTLSLLACGLIGLLAYAWRKRR